MLFINNLITYLGVYLSQRLHDPVHQVSRDTLKSVLIRGKCLNNAVLFQKSIGTQVQSYDLVRQFNTTLLLSLPESRKRRSDTGVVNHHGRYDCDPNRSTERDGLSCSFVLYPFLNFSRIRDLERENDKNPGTVGPSFDPNRMICSFPRSGSVR